MKEVKKEQPELSTEEQELKEKLEALWTVCPEKAGYTEDDQYIEGLDSDEAGATRIKDESGNGTGVRIKFRQPKRPSPPTQDS